MPLGALKMNQEVHATDFGGQTPKVHETYLPASSVRWTTSELGGWRMDERVSDSIRAKARKNHALLLRCMAEVSQKRVATLIGVSETTMSNIKNDDLERFAALVAACGLKLAPVTDQTYDEAFISALKTLAAIGLGRGDVRRDEGADE